MVTNWQHQTHRRAMIVFDQLRAALACAPSEEARAAFLADPGNPYLDLLDGLYGEDFQLARLLDLSDLVVRAEGPELRDPMPALRATTWLCDVANKQLRHLIVATMDLGEHERRRVARNINLRLTGLAPGSLYAGFRLLPEHDEDLLDAALEAAYADARGAMQDLSKIPSYIDNDRVSPDIAGVLPDPAVRDASLLAAFHLSPTGKLGIHTLGLSVPGAEATELGQRERVVLREALRRPDLADGHAGKFIGEIRELDMDKTRFHLRGVSGVGTLRCVLPEVPDSRQAKALMGETVAVSGRYATDAAGRPRLLLVESLDAIRVIPQPAQQRLL